MTRTSDKAPTQRQLRVGEEIRHALAEVFERGTVRDPAVAGVALTVTEVRISPDLRNATVFLVRLGGGPLDEVLTGLRKARAFLRREVAIRIHTKFVPDLRFESDPSFDYAEYINGLLHRPEVARDLGAPPSAEDDGDDGDEEDDGAEDGAAAAAPPPADEGR
ncbi:ribosome-binding factor A [Rhodospirillum rubrum]|uniref:30S ribosome-binding factor RbfA n=1 Tax=Rhodospirillum rubrum TaxID=1085 RepID=UPI001907D9F1|nr:30S ribosome-binding factor RbfA [Rhodospirillum rubrum]MBK1664678.1 ribosome-binding factor A [Rhodospirillum rubrum]MBK1677582.1 ribosome-binding factor A [Rhodospirillum rubrum]